MLIVMIPAGTMTLIDVPENVQQGFLIKAVDKVPSDPETAFERDAMISAAGMVDRGSGALFPVVPHGPEARPDPLPPLTGAVRLTLKRIPGRPDMILFTANGYSRPVRYRAEFIYAVGSKPVATSICPVAAGSNGIEHWPHSFIYLKIYDVALLKEGDRIDPTCVLPNATVPPTI